MTPTQIAAFRTFLIESLQAAPDPSSDPISFPAANVRRSYGDFPRGVPLWCTFRLASGDGYGATGATEHEPMRMIYRIEFTGDTAAVTVALAPANSDFDPATTGPIGPTGGGDPAALRDAVLTALQALEGPDHPATYAGDDSWANPAILATATEAARGVWLDLTVTGADAAATVTRDNLAVHTSDAGEQVVSIQCYSKQSDQPSGPDDNVNAVNLLEKVRTRMKSAIATETLREANVAPIRWQPVRDISGLLRGSQWESRAVLDVTLSVMRAIVEQPGTIESAHIVGTLSPVTDDPINIDTRS